ncbi:glycine receptor subunit alpha-2-like [Haliotis rufescens]|uniref:glycine receptor subunit alpha-2-like n=1 Tax=Haliotis rufescens TaxID=6454 RepID=UPI00201F5C30|nr:glycine receptor subunit alpha-2-like [Haliotis rufescens]
MHKTSLNEERSFAVAPIASSKDSAQYIYEWLSAVDELWVDFQDILCQIQAPELKEFSASFLLRQEWRDPRLKYDDLNRSIVISEKRLDSLWVPDLYFPNSKRASRHEITTPNVLILLSPDGTILYSQRLSVTLACPMNLINFPMDKQTCHIDMESYSHTSTDIYYEFATERDAVDSRPGVQIPDFLITDVTVGNCQNKYTTGAYTCLRVDVSIEREIGFYATQTYVPSILIVVLSWASFWIDHEAVPARISVGLLTVLTITTQSSGARAQLPRVPYVKAIDVWMSACLVFVFAAYMEYAVVTVMFRRHKKVLKQDDSISQLNQLTKEPSRDEVKTGNGKPEMRNADYSKDRSRQVDNISKYGFPISFLVFNIVYWVYYLHLA